MEFEKTANKANKYFILCPYFLINYIAIFKKIFYFC